MFCNQCEQTAKGAGCIHQGVCGKTSDTAYLQDVLVYALRGLALVALEARGKNLINKETDRLFVKAVFSTLTNVQFDDKPLLELIQKVAEAKNALARQAGIVEFAGPAAFTAEQSYTTDASNLYSTEHMAEDADINSLMQILVYGVKGAAAYADHAAILGQEDPRLYEALYQAMAAGFDNKTRSLNDWVAAVLDCGKANIRAMELLDLGNTGSFGHPEPTEVPLGPKEGKAILVSGHDLKDLKNLLEATQGAGINIYTHGEMLPGHAYPELKKFSHFAGHYGTAWQNQQKEFPDFPGAILFTTNCIQKPSANYIDRVFTTGLVGFPGVCHVENNDFSKVIACAKSMAGFSRQDEANGNKAKVLTGFARNTVLGVADKVVEGVKSGAIRHFFLVGGCDGAKPGRNYYTEFVEKAPEDTLILTLACGKFRFFDKNLGTIGGIPRLLDVGQCNDAYSAVKIALALAEAFQCGVNDLPLSFILSWYEQKAVAILLSLLAIGVKNIRLGPTLPAFITPNVLEFLVDTFAIKPITTPDEDLKAILG